MKKIYLLTAGICLSVTLLAQSPGGVSTGLSLWLRADATSTLNLTGSNVNSWTYFNNVSNSFTYGAGTQATVVNNSLNGLPGILFNGTKMDGPTGANAPLAAGSEAYAVFAVWNTASGTASPQRVWTQWDSLAAPPAGNGTSLWLYNPGTGLEWGDQPEISPYTQGVSTANTAIAGQFYISEMNLLNATSNDLELTDQTNFSAGPTVLSTGNGANARANLSTLTNELGCRETVTDEPYNGTLEELIVYSNSISAGASKNQIFSYLSMKYGIPIGTNLVSSAGTTIWDAAANSTYNNDVFGLAYDVASGLNVQQSQASTTAGVSGAGNVFVSASDLLNADQMFMMIGHDNGSLSSEESTDMPAYAAGSMRLPRNWWVQNTGSVGRVNVSFDLTGTGFSGSLSSTSNFRMMVSAGDPTFASTTGLYTPTSITGNVLNFSNVKMPDGSVFAFITNASGATPLPVDFVSFTAQANGGDVDLNWVVGDNGQANNYAVERSTNGKDFIVIGNVANNVDETNYSFVDQNAGSGTSYYRILETDQNGQSIYSPTATVSIGAGDFSIKVLNNPSVGITEAELQINAVSTGKAFVELWSAGGSRINLMEQAIGTGPNTLTVPMAGLPAGSYVVKVMVNNVTKTVQVVKL